MSQAPKSTRLRRSVAAFVAAVAMVFGGSLAISPAYAAVGDIQINDVNGAVNPGVEFLVHDVTSVLPDSYLTTGPGGVINVSAVPDGDYLISPTDLVVYDTSTAPTVNIVGGVPDYSVITLTMNARVYGSLPDDAGSGGTRIDLLYFDGVDWVSGTSWTVVNDAEGDFSLPLLNGPQVYTLYFTEEESTPYLSSYLGRQEAVFDSANFVAGSVDSPINLYDVDLLVAGTIEGTVTRPDTAPVSGIDVHALSTLEGNGTYTVQTEPDGTFRIKTHADFDYEVWIDTAPWVTQYFDNQPDASTASAVNPSPSSIGIDFVLQTPPPDLSGILTDSLGDPVDVETHLFKYDAGYDEFIEVDLEALGDNYDFSDLEYGDYRLAFWDTTVGEWMPWDSGHYVDLFLDTVITPVVGQECYVAFDVDPGYGDLQFDAVLHPADYTHGSCKSPAVNGDDRGTFSGSVIDYDYSTMGDVLASLYLENGSGPEWEGTVYVNPDGSYSIPGVDEDGVYYVRFGTPEDKPWADTWLGGFWTGATNAQLDAYNAGPTLTAYRDSSGHDVELVPASVFSGTLTTSGNPLPYTQVDAWDPFGEGASASSDVDGRYTVKVPAGGDYFVAVRDSMYYEQYWQNAPDDVSATVFDNSAQGVNTNVDFDMVVRPGIVYGQLWEPTGPGTMAPINDVWVHLFELQGYSWVEVQSQPSSGAGYYYFEVDASGTDFRVRFSDSGGNWIGLTEYLAGNSGPRTPWNVSSSCYVDFTSVFAGDEWFADGLLDPSDTTTCGPEDVVLSGRLVETQGLSAGAPIANQYVEVSNDGGCGCGTTYSTYTDSDGYFSFNGLPDDTYYLSVPTSEHTTGSGEHSYTPYYDSITTAGSAYFGEIELTRYGNVFGHIDNWDPSMTGATVMVIFDGGGSSWDPSSYIEVEVDSNGDFDVPGVDVDGTYTVAFFMPDSAPFLDSVLGGQVLGPALDFDTVETFTGVAEEDYYSVSMTVPGAHLIQGVVSYQPPAPDPLELLAGVDVIAFSEDFSYVATTETDVNGEYTLKVAPGLTYQVFVSAGSPYLDQAWDGHNGCGCDYDPLTAGAAGDPPSTGIDFHLLTEDDVVVFDLYTSLFNGNDFEDVTVHLYQQVAGVWTETATSDTDSDGLTLLYGLADDDYRVKFSDGTTWLPIVDVEDATNPGPITLDSQCYFEFDGAETGDEYVYDFHLNEGATAGACGNAAAPPSGGGGSGGSGHHTTGGSTAEPTATPTPTPTATSTPDDEADDSGGSVPGRSTDDATDEPVAPTPDFPWGGWLIVVVIVLCVGGVGFVLLRRR